MIMVLLLLAGCTTIAGQPQPAAPAPLTAAGPARPRDVPIDGVDPCSLLTEEQREELGLDGRSLLDQSPSLLYPGEVPMCVISGFEPRAIAVGVSVIATAGIELFTSGELAADVKRVEVAGFPAAVATPTQYTHFCTVVIDVAPGQLVDVQAMDGGRKPPIPQEQLCQDAEEGANAAMTTLLTLR
jgi:Protein of unknown function (DUF3558)